MHCRIIIFSDSCSRVADDDPLAAETGVTEKTREPAYFVHPSNVNIHVWDLPGIGTPNYRNLPGFLKKVPIEKYDSFLIVCSDRFTEFDLQLAKKVQEMGKSFFFVRTKIDCSRYSEKRKLKEKYDEAKMLELIRDDCIRSLRSLNVGKENVFLLSSHFPNKWDFGLLQKAILDGLPAKQKEALMLSMHASSSEVLCEKIDCLKGKCW